MPCRFAFFLRLPGAGQGKRAFGVWGFGGLGFWGLGVLGALGFRVEGFRGFGDHVR